MTERRELTTCPDCGGDCEAIVAAVEQRSADALLLSIASTQVVLGDVSRDTVKALIASREVESIKIGRRRLVVRASLDDFVARQRRDAADEARSAGA